MGDLNHICKKKLDKSCITHDAAYSDSKNLLKELFQTRF